MWKDFDHPHIAKNGQTFLWKKTIVESSTIDCKRLIGKQFIASRRHFELLALWIVGTVSRLTSHLTVIVMYRVNVLFPPHWFVKLLHQNIKLWICRKYGYGWGIWLISKNLQCHIAYILQSISLSVFIYHINIFPHNWFSGGLFFQVSTPKYVFVSKLASLFFDILIK